MCGYVYSGNDKAGDYISIVKRICTGKGECRAMGYEHGGNAYRYGNVIDFSANINPLGTPEGIIGCAADALSGIAQYPDTECVELRGRISEEYEEYLINKDFVICGNGAADLIYRLMLAVRPETALLVSPCFNEYEQALRLSGAKIMYYDLDHCEFKVDSSFVGFLEDRINEIDMLCLCSPNNPTGKVIERSTAEEILELCKNHGVFVLYDECFNDFLEESGRYTLADMVKTHKNLFILKAFTKMYALAGLRLGYGFCSDIVLLEKMYAAGPPWNVSSLVQCAGIAALNERDFVRETLNTIRTEREWIYKQFDHIGLKYWKSDANFILFRYDSHQGNLKTMLLEKGILIRDCSNYRNLCEGFYRIAVKTREDNEALIRAIQRLKHIK